jgi:thioredoxin reductase
VEIATFHPNIALELKPMNHWDHLMPRVISSKIVIHPNTWVKKISGRRVTLYNVYLDSEQKILQFDNVILVTGRMQNDELYSMFQKKGKPVYRVGDSNIGGARIGNAIYDGNAVARAL